MGAFVVSFLVGVVCLVLGFVNRSGNISPLHEYHRSRVSEEDRIPFGRKVGLGTVIIGAGIMAFSVLGTVTLYTGKDLFILIGTALMLLTIVIGMAITFAAMKKYNKGIF